MILRYMVLLVLVTLAVVAAVMLGESGPWYFSWVLGTGLMILASSMGAILLDQQEEAEAGDKS